MLRKSLFLTFIVLAQGSVFAQAKKSGNTAWTKYRHEGAFHFGLNSIYRNLGQDDRFGLRPFMQRSTFTLTYRYYLMKHFTVRGNFTHAYARKNDKLFDSNFEREPHNLRIDYKTTITEFAAMAEYHIWDETQMGKKKKVRRSRGGMTKSNNLGLSIFSGIAFDYLRPVGEFHGSPVVLRPINSNPGYDLNVGKYRRWNLHIPVAVTGRYVLNEYLRVGVELGYRMGFREYIDNVSAVYYKDQMPNHLAPAWPDRTYTGGMVTFAKENAPLNVLESDKGRKGYFIGMFTLAYRLKS